MFFKTAKVKETDFPMPSCGIYVYLVYLAFQKKLNISGRMASKLGAPLSVKGAKYNPKGLGIMTLKCVEFPSAVLTNLL
jgi:hypothetical protein